MFRPFLMIPLLLGTCGMFLLGSCATYERSMLPGSASSMARDQIMLVRETPPTFGYHRLLGHRRSYPDLEVFVSQQGVPDFLAETHNHGRHYLILYFLARRQAYACRSQPGRGGGAEFSGPYPVTPHEYEVLDGIRRKGGG